MIRLRHGMALLLMVGVLGVVSGCITRAQNPAATQPATALDPATASAEYWLAQPAVASIDHTHFEQLWSAAEDAARERFFTIDRADYRAGLLTTLPSTSEQFFEPWRRDVVTAHDLAESSLATVRRTVQFGFTRNDDGTFTAVPKVVVERQAVLGRRLTAAAQYRTAFSAAAPDTRRTRRGAAIPPRYWYAIGRDEALEKAIADSVRGKLR